MTGATNVLLALDLLGTLAFALNGAMTAIRTTRLDIVGVVTLGLITGVGGGIIRDTLLGTLPPATFVDWRYLAVAALGGLVAFGFSGALARVSGVIEVMDAVGLSLFALAGAAKALELGTGPVQAIILGTVTAVGGGTLRDVLIRQVPAVLSSGLYAIPALAGATVGVLVTSAVGADTLTAPAALTGAALCFAIRMVGWRYHLDAPLPRGAAPPPADAAGPDPEDGS